MSELLGFLLGVIVVVVLVGLCVCVAFGWHYHDQRHRNEMHRLAVEVADSRKAPDAYGNANLRLDRSIELIEEGGTRSNGALRRLQHPSSQATMPPVGTSLTTTTRVTTTTSTSRTPSPAPPSDVQSRAAGLNNLSIGKPLAGRSNLDFRRRDQHVRGLTRAQRDQIERRIGKETAQDLYSRLTKAETAKLAELFGGTYADTAFTDQTTSVIAGLRPAKEQNAGNSDPTPEEKWLEQQSDPNRSEETRRIAAYFGEMDGTDVVINGNTLPLMQKFVEIFKGDDYITFKGIIEKYRVEDEKETFKHFVDFYRKFRSDLSKKGDPKKVELDFSLESDGEPVVDLHPYKIENALVAMIGCGEFPADKQQNYPNLTGIKTDYLNMIEVWTEYWGYDFMFSRSINDNEYQVDLITKEKLKQRQEYYLKAHDLRPDQLTSQHRHQYYTYTCEKEDAGTMEQFANKKNHFKFKTSWTTLENVQIPESKQEYPEYEHEFAHFVESVKNHIRVTNPQALIFIISTHGDVERVIIDSDAEEYELRNLFARFQVNHKAPNKFKNLMHVPKVFFIDACRGDKTASAVGKGTSGAETHLQLVDAPNSQRVAKAMFQKALHTTSKSAFLALSEEEADPLLNLVPLEPREKIGLPSRLLHILRGYKGSIPENPKVTIRSHFLVVWATDDDYATPDGGKKGGYLIRAVNQAFKNHRGTETSLRRFIEQVRSRGNALIGKALVLPVQVVDDLDLQPFLVAKFQPSAVKKPVEPDPSFFAYQNDT